MKMMIKLFILILLMLLSMGFFLLIERKLMGLIQFRLGPNKVTFIGLVQFLIDMVKLLFKEWFSMFFFQINYYLCLLMLLFFSLIFWLLINFNYFNFMNTYYLIVLLSLMLLKMLLLVLFLLMHKSMYIQLSFIRVIVQFISYDIMIILVIIMFIMLVVSFNLLNLLFIQKYLMLINFNFYFFIIWIISLMMEILRLPFDFYESESELISGFNLELGSMGFMLLFMMEYLDMVYFLNLSALLFFFGSFFYLNLMLLLIMILWVRVLVIRFRYDKMLYMMWKKLFFILLLIIFFTVLIINL